MDVTFLDANQYFMVECFFIHASTLVTTSAFAHPEVVNCYDLVICPWLLSIPFYSGRGSCVLC